MRRCWFAAPKLHVGEVREAYEAVPGEDGDGVERWSVRVLSVLSLAGVLSVSAGAFSLKLALVSVLLLAAGALWAGLPWSSRPLEFQSRIFGLWSALSRLERLSLGALFLALGLSLLAALAPSTGWDATVAHLALPAAYAREGRLYLEPGNVYSAYPHLMHGLYTLAFFVLGERGAALLGWFMGVLACASVYGLGHQLGGRRCGLLSAGILATAPIFVDQAGTVSVDLAFAAFATAALSLATRWRDIGDPRALALAGGLAGSACGIRHTGYIVCVLLACGILLTPRGGRIRAVCFFSAAALLGALPWMARSAWLTGNPVFPLLLAWFPAHGIEHIAVDGAQAHGSVLRSGGYSLWGLLWFPLELVLRPQAYDGWMKSPGFLVLVLGLPGVFLGGAPCRRLGAYGAAGMAIFYFFQRLARYALPFFIPMMAVAALAEQQVRGRTRMVVLGVLLLSFVSGFAVHGAALSFKIPVLLGLEAREDYLARRVERYPAFVYASTQLNAPGTLLTLDQRSYFVRNRRTFQNHWALKRVATLPPEGQLQWLRDNQIRYVLYPVDFVRASGAIAHDVGPMLDAWQRDSAHFRAVKSMETPNVRGQGMERVDILEFAP